MKIFKMLNIKNILIILEKDICKHNTSGQKKEKVDHIKA